MSIKTNLFQDSKLELKRVSGKRLVGAKSIAAGALMAGANQLRHALKDMKAIEIEVPAELGS